MENLVFALYGKVLIGVFYLSLLVFIIFPLITGKYWGKDETIERNINKLVKKIVFWFAFFVHVLFRWLY
ncbi:hypothetical protein [Anaerobium acetethylicum]|uniref:Uncharacterized protein n=1 Tax=Anaerobium acetethylicum TaxID=1619234 RepID=A0A1D3TVV2_9FIRM|nr:hypothetical protein [Anaerobium acetethylicum]SCP98310.1 hypothetical protein SAMN05421730_101919 [Anaerobium acetethylicum]